RRACLPVLALDEVLWERIEQLPDEPRRLLEIAAVAGQPLKQAAACQAAGVVGGEFAALHLLRSSHLLRSTGPGQQDGIETFHDQIRETVTAHLTESELRHRHLCLAQTRAADREADPEFLAVQFQAAGKWE